MSDTEARVLNAQAIASAVIDGLSAAFKRLSKRYKKLKRRIEALERTQGTGGNNVTFHAMPGHSPTAPAAPDPRVDDLQRQVASLEARIANPHPDVAAIRTELERVNAIVAALRAEVSPTLAEQLDRIRDRVTAIEDHRVALTEHLDHPDHGLAAAHRRVDVLERRPGPADHAEWDAVKTGATAGATAGTIATATKVHSERTRMIALASVAGVLVAVLFVLVWSVIHTYRTQARMEEAFKPRDTKIAALELRPVLTERVAALESRPQPVDRGPEIQTLRNQVNELASKPAPVTTSPSGAVDPTWAGSIGQRFNELDDRITELAGMVTDNGNLLADHTAQLGDHETRIVTLENPAAKPAPAAAEKPPAAKATAAPHRAGAPAQRPAAPVTAQVRAPSTTSVAYANVQVAGTYPNGDVAVVVGLPPGARPCGLPGGREVLARLLSTGNACP